jgi:dolichol-phosphate mannosyltransferase
MKLILRKGKRGLATAVAEGIQNAKGEVLVWMDCDLSQPPALIPKLVETLQECDIALSSRYVKGGRMRYSLPRRLASRMINIFAGLFLGFSVRDYTSGFLAVKREVLNKVEIKSLGGGYGEYFIAFLYDAKRFGFKIKEIPYVYLPRRLGLSKTSPCPASLIKHGFSYCRAILFLKFKDAKSY